MFKQVLEKDLKEAVHDLGFVVGDIVLSIPENANHGDYSWNGALQLAKQNLKKDYQNPVEIANAVLQKLGHPKYLERVEVAGVGFLNFFIKDESLIVALESNESEESKVGKKYLVEYADLNTHKVVHIGHLRTLIVGESISRILEFQGHEVFRVNYGSDIGPTIGKSLWGIEHLKDKYEAVKNKSLKEKVDFLGEAYTFAHAEYEANKSVKAEIDELTRRIYQRDPELMELWEETKLWSLAYFDTLYARFNTEFDLRVNESEVDERGKEVVMQNIGKVFIEDQGAIIFPGENYGLHNRVFITSAGHPTYEGKEVGLIEKYQEVFPFDEAIILSDVQQAGFFEVVNKAIELIYPHLIGRKKYLGYGFVGLTTGKMSSRTGNVISAEQLLEKVVEVLEEQFKSKTDKETIGKIAVAAIKFSYLKYSLNSDISFDIQNSTSLQGDSGPYVQYTYARINSLINRATLRQGSALQASDPDEEENNKIAQEVDSSLRSGSAGEAISKKNQIAASLRAPRNDNKWLIGSLEPEEREVLRKLEYFEAMAEKAAKEFKPNEIALYLLSLTKAFNFFYEKHGILGSKKEEFRLLLSKKVGETIKLGLYLLGIDVVERM